MISKSFVTLLVFALTASVNAAPAGFARQDSAPVVCDCISKRAAAPGALFARQDCCQPLDPEPIGPLLPPFFTPIPPDSASPTATFAPDPNETGE